MSLIVFVFIYLCYLKSIYNILNYIYIYMAERKFPPKNTRASLLSRLLDVAKVLCGATGFHGHLLFRLCFRETFAKKRLQNKQNSTP